MESRFATLRQRDSSVSMLRVKLSRRRSQCQKENRGKAVNSRRQLEKLSELDQSAVADASVLTRNMSVIQEKAGNVSKAVTSRWHVSSGSLITLLYRLPPFHTHWAIIQVVLGYYYAYLISDYVFFDILCTLSFDLVSLCF